MLLSWFAFPLALLLICLGCGMLVREVSRVAIPGPLLVPLGLAFVIVLSELTTIGGSTTQLSAPLAVAAAVGGFLLGRPQLSWLGGASWACVAAGVVFALYAAPIVLSGEATFAGYVKLDDTSTWLAITDRLMEHGRDLGGLAPSTYEATLSFNLASGYPIGAFLPLGIGTELTGSDPAWLFQAYMAAIAALLALCLYAIAAELVRSAPLSAAVAVLGSLSALFVGYYLWGGVKEIASAALLALLVPLLPAALQGWRSWRNALPAALAASALIALLSPGGAGIWLAPALGLTVLLGLRLQGLGRTGRAAAAFAVVLAALSLPWLLDGGFVPRDAGALTDPRELGNLFEPLSLWQGFGIWPVGDFRVDPVDPAITGILIAVVVIAALAGAVLALRERVFVPVLFVTALLLGALLLIALGSPWIDAKALATVSPAILFAGALGGAALIERRSYIEGGAALAAIAVGALWSYALAYDEVSLAPRERLAELEYIGEEIAGAGPTLMTDYEPYGVRHFLRDADPEGASELRRRVVPLREGRGLEKGEFADIDRFDLAALLEYRTLVLRRSPLASRPPLPFDLTWRGEHYEVWQQDASLATPLEHLPLGGDRAPSARADCAAVRRLAQAPGAAHLAAASRQPPLPIGVGTLALPGSWTVEEADTSLAYPGGSGIATGRFTLGSGGRLGVWVGGSFRGRVEVRIGGSAVGAERHLIDHQGLPTQVGRIELGPGTHRLELGYDDGGARPGSGGDPFGLGPILISSATAADAVVEYLDPADAAELCGRRLDWIEALPG